jgi:predicted HTH domain antitoxin
MTNVVFQVPEGVLASLRLDPQRFAKELRIAAGVKWYENGTVSQERAAEIAGLSRAEFIDALGQFKVTPFQESLQELIQEASDE